MRDMKNAFRPMPNQCRDALMAAACSVKEEEPMKRTTFRVALIAAAIVVATMALAFAAGQLGLSDLFKNSYDTNLPESAKTALSDTEQKSYVVGPLTITLRETLSDGRLAYVTTQAKTTDGTKAAIYMEMPQKADGPIYLVSSYLTLDEKHLTGSEEMMDAIPGEDGSALFVHMLMTNPDTLSETLNGTLNLLVRQMDPKTRLEIEAWQLEDAIAIPVIGVTAEKTYMPQGEAILAGYTVNSVKAEKTCAGVYLTATLTAEEGTLERDVYSLYKFVEFRDSKGQRFPVGISLTGSIDHDNWPTVTMTEMISLDDLPDSFQLVENKTVILK